MINIDRKWLVAGIAAAALQTAAIGWIVWDRISLLKNGREIVLPIIPVDPRSLFRGDYVILDYPVSAVAANLMSSTMKSARPANFYVTLKKTDGEWEPVAFSEKPQASDANQITLKARMRYGWSESTRRRPVAPSGTSTGSATATPVTPPDLVYNVRYGIESYFVPEGKGLALEALAREKKLAAVIAVDARGNSAIKGLMIDGKLQYEEPLL
jgi:uncharacterized membrane-anchored protein